ncbi:hypothetical protein C1H46_001734 [Malus baccata]|uniref:Uncharacterized protein n=1 Tax=Malus baccata TaxID=106549 RepID=A0A540NNU2_MALBA|nr:hypothetical protein C1H46_001734 [Malus baccata]
MNRSNNRDENDDLALSLLPESVLPGNGADDKDEKQDLSIRVWIETNKIWQIAGLAIFRLYLINTPVFSRLTSFTMNVITQAFAGHLGEVELTAISIANTLIVGFIFGLLLGMASAIETLCGQAFGAKRYHMLGIILAEVMDLVVSMLLCPLTSLHIHHSTARADQRGGGGVVRSGGTVAQRGR